MVLRTEAIFLFLLKKVKPLAWHLALSFAVNRHAVGAEYNPSNVSPVFCCLFLVLNVMDDYGNTPLHWAAGKNQVESVKFLLRKGANPNLRNCSMMAPLHVAVQGGYNDVMKVSLLAVPRPSNIAWAGPQVQLCLLCPKGQPRLPGPTTCDDFKVGFSSDQNHLHRDRDDDDVKNNKHHLIFLISSYVSATSLFLCLGAFCVFGF